MAKKIQNRMLNGFNTWNLGYDAWEHWGEVLYSPESIYNVHSVHFTLGEYQQAKAVSQGQLLLVQKGHRLRRRGPGVMQKRARSQNLALFSEKILTLCQNVVY